MHWEAGEGGHGSVKGIEVRILSAAHILKVEGACNILNTNSEFVPTGTERGYLYASSIPEIERFCSFKAHRLRTLEVVPLPPTVSDGALSISAETVRYHSSGGFPRFTYSEELVTHLHHSCYLDKSLMWTWA